MKKLFNKAFGQTNHFRIMKKPASKNVDRDYWYYVQRKFRICFIPFWCDVDFEADERDAMRSIRNKLEIEKIKEKKKLIKKEVVFSIDPKSALLNSQSNDENLRKLSKSIIDSSFSIRG